MISGKWIGTFTLGANYADGLAGKVSEFDMELVGASSNFTGICNDPYTKELFKKPAEVSGSFDGTSITFTKIYPGSVFETPDGKMITIQKIKSQTIIYSGAAAFDESGSPNRFEGSWISTLPYRTWFGFKRQLSSTGTWRMARPAP